MRLQTMLNAGYDPKRRVLNTYSSLPRPSHLMGWSYADQSEVSSHALLRGRAPEGGPEYANLIPWAGDSGRLPAPAPPPRAVHYATLARAPHSKRGLTIRPQASFTYIYHPKLLSSLSKQTAVKYSNSVSFLMSVESSNSIDLDLSFISGSMEETGDFICM